MSVLLAAIVLLLFFLVLSISVSATSIITNSISVWLLQISLLLGKRNSWLLIKISSILLTVRCAVDSCTPQSYAM